MVSPAIGGIGKALTDYCMEQMYICVGMDGAFSSRRAPALFRATQVESRHLVQGGLDWYRAKPSNGERLAAHIEKAPHLSVRAADRLFSRQTFNHSKSTPWLSHRPRALTAQASTSRLRTFFRCRRTCA